MSGRGTLLGVLLVFGPSCSGTSLKHCEESVYGIQRQIGQVVRARQDGCVTHEDCALMNADVSCFSGCPHAVRAGTETAARAEIDAIGKKDCLPGCQASGDCGRIERAVCSGGRCSLGRDDGGTYP